MKVLLSTYSCFPCQSSEPGRAWRAINEALREHEVWAAIFNGHEYRELTEPWFAKNPLPNFHPVFFKLPPALSWLRRQGAALAGFLEKTDRDRALPATLLATMSAARAHVRNNFTVARSMSGCGIIMPKRSHNTVTEKDVNLPSRFERLTRAALQ